MGTTPIAVFGSSEPLRGTPLYEQAYELGARLARERFSVVSGGYGGVMEAASRGALEAGGATVGVSCRIFEDREPNAFLSKLIVADDLHARQRELIDLARGYVVMEGRAGTLAELAMLWALNRAGCLAGRPVVLLGVYWSPIVKQLSDNGMLASEQLDAMTVVPTPREAVAALGRVEGR